MRPAEGLLPQALHQMSVAIAWQNFPQACRVLHQVAAEAVVSWLCLHPPARLAELALSAVQWLDALVAAKMVLGQTREVQPLEARVMLPVAIVVADMVLGAAVTVGVVAA